MHIYKITCLLNSKVYIGLSIKEPDEKYFGSGQLIKKAIKKYGKTNFKKEIIEYCDTLEKLCEREIYWITYYKNTLKEGCYNIASGGHSGSWKAWMSEDKLKIVLDNIKKSAELKKGKYSSWNKGLKYKNEKISKALTGKKQPAEVIEKRRKKLIGKKRTVEQIKKQSEAIRHRYKEGFSEDHKRKLSDSHKGISMSESAKEKLRKKQEIIVCPYCSKSGGKPIMKRYHFENCKQKK